ncbi:MAG: hypothetical protein LBF08_06650 [Dysgonamonadaceae bacterium]|jgi:hypothetical protein|nr:hypothetical protein [Dysgonamonadaceae bacterium]
MNRFIKLFTLLFIVSGFASCLDNNNSDSHYFFYDEPAIVESLSDSSIVRTAYGKFCVLSLKDTDLQTNDILWSSFVVEKTDENKVQMPDNLFYYRATEFRYEKIGGAKVIIPSDTAEFASYLRDAYREKINRAVLYRTYVDSLLFFGFEHTASDANIEYELVLNPEIERSNGYPTLYIRAKAAAGIHRGKRIFAFDMADFIRYYKVHFPAENTLQFNLKYYIETENDRDVYREFLSNPLSWHIR